MANCTNGAKDLNNFVSKCRKRSNNGWPFKSVYEMKTKCSTRSTAIFFGQPCVWYGTSSIYSTLAVNVDAIREHKSRKPKIGSCISQLLSSSEIGHFVRMCSRVKMRRDANRKTKWTEGRRLYVTWRWYWCGAHVVDSVNVSCFLKQLASHTAAAAAAVAAANDAPYELFIVGSCSFWTRSTHIVNSVREQQNEACYSYNCCTSPPCPQRQTNSIAQGMPISCFQSNCKEPTDAIVVGGSLQRTLMR